jgi:hypothetical protein
MATAWGLVLIVLSLLCWGGQALAWFAPATAARLGLAETEEAVDPVFHADGRGEALWDTLTLWVLVVAGVLLVADSQAWPYFGLAGGAVYTYFAGRGVLTRRAMELRGLRIGTAGNVTIAYVFLSIWGAMGLVTVVAAAVALA